MTIFKKIIGSTLYVPMGKRLSHHPSRWSPSSILGRDTKRAVHNLWICKSVKDLTLSERKTHFNWVSDVSNAPRKRIFVIVRFPEKLFERRSEAQICLLLPPNTSFFSTNYHIMIKCGENLIWGISSVGRASA